MNNKTLRIAKWWIRRTLRCCSELVREYYTPTTDDRHTKVYDDYPVDYLWPRLISPRTLRRLMSRTGRAVVIATLCLNTATAQEAAPRIHGILRGKYEYQPEMDASRFEVRNARLSAEGSLTLRSAYKLEVDLCDESAIKMKDAWVRLLPWRSLRLTFGQQRMPFSIDAHRNPSAQYFANRSFIAKQVGDMRDVGFQAGYDFYTQGPDRRKLLSLDAGVFNGSNLDNQKTAWFTSPSYSARAQLYPVKGWAVVPSIQHQRIASREAAYTSLDLGSYYEANGWHIEAEYLLKTYRHAAFADCDAFDAMVIYRQPIKRDKAYVNAVSYLLRFDCMDDHSDGKKGLTEDGKLILTDYARRRFTAGLTFSIDNTHFPTDLRLNYERYNYPHGGVAKESEQDKVVCEVMIRF